MSEPPSSHNPDSSSKLFLHSESLPDQSFESASQEQSGGQAASREQSVGLSDSKSLASLGSDATSRGPSVGSSTPAAPGPNALSFIFYYRRFPGLFAVYLFALELFTFMHLLSYFHVPASTIHLPSCTWSAPEPVQCKIETRPLLIAETVGAAVSQYLDIWFNLLEPPATVESDFAQPLRPRPIHAFHRITTEVEHLCQHAKELSSRPDVKQHCDAYARTVRELRQAGMDYFVYPFSVHGWDESFVTRALRDYVLIAHRTSLAAVQSLIDENSLAPFETKEAGGDSGQCAQRDQRKTIFVLSNALLANIHTWKHKHHPAVAKSFQYYEEKIGELSQTQGWIVDTFDNVFAVSKSESKKKGLKRNFAASREAELKKTYGFYTIGAVRKALYILEQFPTTITDVHVAFANATAGLADPYQTFSQLEDNLLALQNQCNQELRNEQFWQRWLWSHLQRKPCPPRWIIPGEWEIKYDLGMVQDDFESRLKRVARNSLNWLKYDKQVLSAIPRLHESELGFAAESAAEPTEPDSISKGWFNKVWWGN